MIEERKYCSDVMKKSFNKKLLMTKKTMKILKTQLNIRFVAMIMLIMMLKQECIVILLEYIEALHIEIVISISS